MKTTCNNESETKIFLKNRIPLDNSYEIFNPTEFEFEIITSKVANTYDSKQKTTTIKQITMHLHWDIRPLNGRKNFGHVSF